MILLLKKDIVTSFKPLFEIKKLSYEDKAKLFENFAILLKSGIPIVKSLDIIKQQGEKLKFLDIVKENLFLGKSLKFSMEQTSCFDELSLTLIEVGEKTGKLDEAFLRMSKYYKHMDEMYKDVKSASYYPIFILSMLLFLFGFIIFYFIPNIISLYGGEIPKIGGWAELLISHSLFIKEYFMELFLTCSILIILIIKLVIVSINPLFFSQIKFKLPLVGNLIFKQSLNNLVWALETMLGSGVDILNALSVLENVTKDPVVLSKLKIIQTSVLGGNSLSDSIVDAKISEPNLLYFVNIGEETGDLENRLNNLSYLYTQEIKRKSKELTSMAQPVFITIITLAIGITMLTIIMPLLDYELLYKI